MVDAQAKFSEFIGKQVKGRLSFGSGWGEKDQIICVGEGAEAAKAREPVKNVAEGDVHVQFKDERREWTALFDSRS